MAASMTQRAFLFTSVLAASWLPTSAWAIAQVVHNSCTESGTAYHLGQTIVQQCTVLYTGFPPNLSSSNSYGWPHQIDWLDPTPNGESVQARVRVTVPVPASATTGTLVSRLILRDGTNGNAPMDSCVTAWPTPELRSAIYAEYNTPQEVSPGGFDIVPVVIRNFFGVPRDMQILASVPPGWSVIPTSQNLYSYPPQDQLTYFFVSAPITMTEPGWLRVITQAPLPYPVSDSLLKPLFPPNTLDAPAPIASLRATNPSRRGLPVSFALLDSRPARLEAWDVAGRRVSSQEVGWLGAGQHQVDLDLADQLPAGVYLVRLRDDNRAVQTRVVRVR